MDWATQGLLVPALLGAGSLVTWFVRSRIEELRTLERSLADKRQETYAKILDPFIQMFANAASDAGQQEVMKKFVSSEHRKTSFDLALIGSDGAVRAYNEMMQYTFTHGQDEMNPAEVMALWGELLLEIRKSLGNSRTKLNKWDMLAQQVKNMQALREGVGV